MDGMVNANACGCEGCSEHCHAHARDNRIEGLRATTKHVLFSMAGFAFLKHTWTVPYAALKRQASGMTQVQHNSALVPTPERHACVQAGPSDAAVLLRDRHRPGDRAHCRAVIGPV